MVDQKEGSGNLSQVSELKGRIGPTALGGSYYYMGEGGESMSGKGSQIWISVSSQFPETL